MNEINCKEYQKIIGNRIKLFRVNAGMSQQDLEDKSGVSARSISRLEQGASVQLENLIKILLALGLDQNLNLLIPDQTKRPSYYLNENGERNKRVHRKKVKNNNFKWGDGK